MALAVCQQCGKGFQVRPSRQNEGKGRYCSRQCYFEAKRRYSFVKRCEHCGKTFFTKRDDARFCSRTCSGKYASRLDAQPSCLCVSSEQLWGSQGLASFADPWASGAIPPDYYGRDLCRTPDIWLGF